MNWSNYERTGTCLYTVAQCKPQKTRPNKEAVGNVLDRKFNDQQELAVVVSDLTYGRVNNRWFYVCFLVDLFNREIIGYSAGPHKDVALVHKAFASVSKGSTVPYGSWS